MQLNKWRSLLTAALLFFILHSSLFILTSCGEIENEYSSHRVYLRFDNSVHLDANLMAAMNPMSSNVFCRIWLLSNGKLSFQSNQGSTSNVTLTASERQSPLVLGISNESGIIVGYGFGGVFYCYDAVCPNCYEKKIERTLTMNTTGIATCSSCSHQYDMTNNGLSPQGGKLERYHATTSGQTGTLIVNNRYY
ncbi:MAG: hypothetical protein IKX61_06375 [Prevotella sp.]|nr:hypothetical protein [Prevotella sp.]